MYRRYKNRRIAELSRVLERGEDLNRDLMSQCAYYPLFTFRRWIDEATGDPRQGQVFVCKKCSIEAPNYMCRHARILKK